MHKIKIILFSLVGITSIFAAILAVMLSNYNNQDYQQLLIKTVDSLSDYTLSIKGPFELHRSYKPVLSASKIELHSKTSTRNIRIDNFRIQITLAPLLRKTLLVNDLLVENMRIEIQAGEEQESSANLLNFFLVPIIEHAELKNVQLISDADNQMHRLDSLVISANDRLAPLEVHSTGIVRGNTFDIKGQLGPLADIFNQQKPYPVNLTATWNQTELFIKGTILDPPQGEGIDLVGKINVPEIAEVVTTIPVKGHMQGRFHLKGALEEPELAEIHVRIFEKQLIDLRVTGSVGDLMTQERTNLHLAGVIHDEKLLTWLMPDNSSPPLNNLTIESDIIGGHQDLILQNLVINLSNGKGLKIDMTGNSHIVLQQQPFRLLDIQATINSSDTTTVKPYLGGVLPEMGPVRGTAHITSQGQDFVLSHINLLAGVDKKVQLKAKGRVGPLSMDEQYDGSKIALDISLNAEQSSELSSLLDIKHPEIGPVAITANLKGSFEQLKLDKIHLKAGSSDVLSILADGWIAWDKLSSDSPLQLTDITIQANTPSLQKAAHLYGEILPNLGAAKLSMRVHGKGEVLEGTDLTLHIGTKNSLLVSIQGKVAQIYYTNLFYKGLELTAILEGQNTSYLSELLENNKIPDIGSISGKFIVLGDSDKLQIPQITLSAGRKNQLLLTASGKISEIPLHQAAAPQGVGIDLTAAAPNSADLSSIVGTEIPDFGRLLIKGQLTDNKGVFSIKDLVLLAGDPKQPVISMSGSVEDILSTDGLQMKILFDETTLIKLFDLHSIPELGQLKGSALLSEDNGAFSIKDLKIESGHSELINLKIIGAIDHVSKAGQITANVDFSIKQPELFGKLFAIDLSGLGPVSIYGLMSGNKQVVTFKGHSFIGKTKLTSDLAFSFIDKPKITGVINSPNIFLEDFGFISMITASPQSEIAKPVKTSLFSEVPIPLDVLNQLDLELKLRLFKMSGIDYLLNKVNIDLLLQNGKLTASPFGFDFSKGRVNVKAEIDAMQIPEWQLSVEGDSIHLGQAFKEQNKQPPVEGDLNLIVNLKSSGNNTHDIAANLEGDFGFTLEKGGVSRSQLELVFLNPLGWLFSHGISGNEFDISCGLGRYQVKNGIISSKVFLIDGPKLFVRGDTEVNLGKETINSVYNLEKKNIFENTIIPNLAPTSVPIKISGYLSDPNIEEVSKPSMMSKADRYIFAPVSMIPQEVLGTVFDLFEDSKEGKSPCTTYLKN